MNLPDKFEFTTTSGDYIAEKHYNTYKVYNVENSNHFGVWFPASMIANIKDGTWKLANQPAPNGVDAAGNPIYFDKTMLKQFDRVVTRGEGTYIAAKLGSGGSYNLEDGNGYIKFYDDIEEASGQEGYVADAVYASEYDWTVLDNRIFGKLIWCRQEFPKKMTPAQKQKKELQASAEAAKKALEEAQEVLGNIQKQIDELGE